jgi:hypothetical protein
MFLPEKKVNENKNLGVRGIFISKRKERELKKKKKKSVVKIVFIYFLTKM